MLHRNGHSDLLPNNHHQGAGSSVAGPASAAVGTSSSDAEQQKQQRSSGRTLALPVAPPTRSERLRGALRSRIQSIRKNRFLTACTAAVVLAVTLTVSEGGGFEASFGSAFGLVSSASSNLRSSVSGGGANDEDGELTVADASDSRKKVRLSRSLQYVAAVDEPIKEGDVPFFFHVPRSGGSTLKDIMGMCLGQVVASDVGTRHGHKYDKTLQILEDEGSKFVNVDTTTAEGIHRAKKLGLVESNMADFIATQLLHPAATMFNKEQRGRMFTMIRHPIERAVSLFHYLGVADWEPTYDPDLAYISIEMYARSKRVEFNWMVRFLSNELERDLTPKHLEVAKEVLKTKCLIGLLTEKGESFARFEKYFGWDYPNRQAKDCQDRLLHWGWSNKHAHPLVEEGTSAWNELHKKNELDMQLYEYAKELFVEQAVLFREGGPFGPDKVAPEQEEGGAVQATVQEQAPAQQGQQRSVATSETGSAQVQMKLISQSQQGPNVSGAGTVQAQVPLPTQGQQVGIAEGVAPGTATASRAMMRTSATP